jgi:hypothetical protein
MSPGKVLHTQQRDLPARLPTAAVTLPVKLCSQAGCWWLGNRLAPAASQRVRVSRYNYLPVPACAKT